jgi:hypothetical protein
MSKERDKTVAQLSRYMPIRDFCRASAWPKLTQINHWIYSNHEIARKCIKKVGARYIIDTQKFEQYVNDNEEFEEIENIEKVFEEKEKTKSTESIHVNINFSEEMQKDVVLKYIKDCVEEQTQKIIEYIDMFLAMKEKINEKNEEVIHE